MLIPGFKSLRPNQIITLSKKSLTQYSCFPKLNSETLERMGILTQNCENKEGDQFLKTK